MFFDSRYQKKPTHTLAKHANYINRPAVTTGNQTSDPQAVSTLPLRAFPPRHSLHLYLKKKKVFSIMLSSILQITCISPGLLPELPVLPSAPILHCPSGHHPPPPAAPAEQAAAPSESSKGNTRLDESSRFKNTGFRFSGSDKAVAGCA